MSKTYKNVWMIVNVAIFQNADASNKESDAGNSSRLTAFRTMGRRPELKIKRSIGDRMARTLAIHGFSDKVFPYEEIWSSDNPHLSN